VADFATSLYTAENFDLKRRKWRLPERNNVGVRHLSYLKMYLWDKIEKNEIGSGRRALEEKSKCTQIYRQRN
jgi:hypothetical protein